MFDRFLLTRFYVHSLDGSTSVICQCLLPHVPKTWGLLFLQYPWVFHWPILIIFLYCNQKWSARIPEIKSTTCTLTMFPHYLIKIFRSKYLHFLHTIFVNKVWIVWSSHSHWRSHSLVCGQLVTMIGFTVSHGVLELSALCVNACRKS